MTRMTSAAAMFLLILTLPLAAQTLPAPLQRDAPELARLGNAKLTWFGLHIYDIALHATNAAYTSNCTAAITIRYNVSIKRHRLVETTLKEWRRMGLGNDTQHAAWTNRLETIWPDVKADESLTAFRAANGPTRFYLGDKPVGEVADPAFGPAFFAIWLGPGCQYPRIRDDLLADPAKGGKARE